MMLHQTLSDFKKRLRQWDGIKKYVKIVSRLSFKKYRNKVDQLKKHLVQMNQKRSLETINKYFIQCKEDQRNKTKFTIVIDNKIQKED